jgi:hypothetical protein
MESVNITTGVLLEQLFVFFYVEETLSFIFIVGERLVFAHFFVFAIVTRGGRSRGDFSMTKPLEGKFGLFVDRSRLP